MGQPTPVIRHVQTPDYGKIIIETSDNKRYHADLKNFANILCFPKDKDAWSKVSIDSYGLGLIWTSRFEVHVDQVIGLAIKVEDIKRTAAG